MRYEIKLREGPVSLRPLTPEDAPLLLRWLTDSRNLEYWEGPGTVFTPERIQADFYQDGWNASRCIIQYEGRDIGYMQAYELDEEMFREYQYPYTPERVFGIDQFIGEPELWGKGIGRRFIGLLCRWLHEARGAKAVVLDPTQITPGLSGAMRPAGSKR